jgi:hypothetical protein
MPSEAEEDVALAKDLVQSAKDRLIRAAKTWRRETTVVATRDLLAAVDSLTHAEQILRDQEAWSNVH